MASFKCATDRIPNHIGGQDSGKSALNAFLDHIGPLGHVPQVSYAMQRAIGSAGLNRADVRSGSNCDMRSKLQNVRCGGGSDIWRCGTPILRPLARTGIPDAV